MTKLGRVTHKSACWRRRIVHRAIAGMLLATPGASAHFVLQSPASWMSQDSSGNPQKLGPCGDEAGGTPTAAVTTFAPGETITITLKETVFHPGHYRVALAVESRDELPAEPEVTAASTPCGSVPIDPSPEFPVLADGALQHTAAFSGPQSIKVTLPSDITCTHCTLQVIEFMSNHTLNKPGGCFYHHCADIAIQPNGGGAPGTGGGSTSLGGSSFRASGGATAATGGRSGSGGSSSPTGGVATGGRQESASGGAETGGMQSLTGGRSALGSGGIPALTGGTSAHTGGTLAVGGSGPEGVGGTGPHDSGGFGAVGASGGLLQSADTGGASAVTVPSGTAGTQVESTGVTPGGQGANGCSCSIPGDPRPPWLSSAVGLIMGFMLLRARTKARPVLRTGRR